MLRLRTHSSPARRGYTIVELLAVAGLLVLLLAFAASGLSGLLRSSERSLAENQLRVGLTAARDLALRSDSDAVAVFFLENGRCRIVPAAFAGVLKNDEVLGVNGQAVPNARVDRDVFVPVTLAEPISLPLRWTVRGFADPGTLDTNAAPTGWYEWINDASPTLAEAGNWLLPETGVLDITQPEEGWRRQTFVVRFEGKTGNLVTNNNATVLVVDVVASDAFREQPPFDQPTNRLDELDDDLLPVVRRMLGSRTLHPVAAQLSQTTDLHRLLGDRSTDTVLARPVQTVALALESTVASGVGARSLSRVTESLQLAPGALTAPSPIDVALFSGLDVTQVQQSINAWVAPDLRDNPDPLPNGVSVQEPFDARIFTFSRYLGAMQEVKP